MSDFTFGFGPQTSAQRVAERPFVLAVMADLSGSPAEPLELVTARNFLAFDVDNLDARLLAARPRVAFSVPNVVTGQGEVAVDITFRDFESFSPAYVASKVGLLTKLCAARGRLAAMRAGKAQVSPAPRELLSQVLDDPALVDALAGDAAPQAEAPPEPETPAPVETGGVLGDLERLMGKKVGSAPAPARSASPLQGLFEQAAAGTPQISAEATQTIGGLVDRLDDAVARQLDLILHHDDLRTLEGTWRGLNFLLENADTDDGLKIRVLNASKAELASLFETGGLLGENPLALKLRGVPCGALIGDLHFSHAAGDVAILKGLGLLASSLGLPFIGGAAAGLFGLATWRELRPTLDAFHVLADDGHASWRELAESSVADRLLLAMPRFLARLPYGRKTNPAEGIEYEEGAPVDDPSKFVWSNAAWAMAAVIASAVSVDGWDATITAGGEDGQVGGLPVYSFTDKDGDSEMMCPTEVSMTVEFGVLLAKAGLAPLLHLKNTDYAVFVRVPSLGSGG